MSNKPDYKEHCKSRIDSTKHRQLFTKRDIVKGEYVRNEELVYDLGLDSLACRVGTDQRVNAVLIHPELVLIGTHDGNPNGTYYGPEVWESKSEDERIIHFMTRSGTLIETEIHSSFLARNNYSGNCLVARIKDSIHPFEHIQHAYFIGADLDAVVPEEWPHNVSGLCVGYTPERRLWVGDLTKYPQTLVNPRTNERWFGKYVKWTRPQSDDDLFGHASSFSPLCIPWTNENTPGIPLGLYGWANFRFRTKQGTFEAGGAVGHYREAIRHAADYLLDIAEEPGSSWDLRFTTLDAGKYQPFHNYDLDPDGPNVK